MPPKKTTKESARKRRHPNSSSSGSSGSDDSSSSSNNSNDSNYVKDHDRLRNGFFGNISTKRSRVEGEADLGRRLLPFLLPADDPDAPHFKAMVAELVGLASGPFDDTDSDDEDDDEADDDDDDDGGYDSLSDGDVSENESEDDYDDDDYEDGDENNDENDIKASSVSGPFPQGYTIHDAAKDGNIDALRFFLDSGVRLNRLNSERYPPLNWAARHGQVKSIEYLVSRGASIKAKDPSSGNALHTAAEHGHPTVIKLLVGLGLRINGKDDWDLTPLHAAAISGQSAAIEQLVSLGAKVDSFDEEYLTPLHLAARFNQPEAVAALVANLADINHKSYLECSALDEAVRHSSVAALEKLLELGASKQTANHKGGSLMHSAAEGHISAPLINKLLSLGLSVTDVDLRGHTPLHRAADHGNFRQDQSDHTAVVEQFVSLGADIDGITQRVNLKPSQIASVYKYERQGFQYVYRPLTPLHIAATSSSRYCAKALLQQGASVNISPPDGETPLHAAIAKGDFKIVKRLISSGSDVDALVGGKTPLQLAIDTHIEMRRFGDEGKRIVKLLALANPTVGPLPEGIAINHLDRGESLESVSSFAPRVPGGRSDDEE